MTAPEPLTSVRSWLALRTDASVYVGRVPGGHSQIDVDQAVLLRHAGTPGRIGRGFQRHYDLRFTLWCYGPTDLIAGQLHADIHRELEQLDRQVAAGMLLHWAEPQGGGGHGEDDDTGWPFITSTWTALVAPMS